MQLKLNRAKQLAEFFEKKYQDTNNELELLRNQISQNFKQLQSKDEALEHQ